MRTGTMKKRSSRRMRLALLAASAAALLYCVPAEAQVGDSEKDTQAKKGSAQDAKAKKGTAQDAKAKKGSTQDAKATKGETEAQRLRRLRMQRNDRILSRKEIEAAMAPHVDGISACYKTNAGSQKGADGHISLEMLIRPEGTIQKLWVVAPSITGAKLSKCVRDLSKAWRFPKKPGFTNAVVPFYFQKSRDPGAGPFQSCWSAKGCPEHRHRKKR